MAGNGPQVHPDVTSDQFEKYSNVYQNYSVDTCGVALEDFVNCMVLSNPVGASDLTALGVKSDIIDGMLRDKVIG